jgi:hypothetical protein
MTSCCAAVHPGYAMSRLIALRGGSSTASREVLLKLFERQYVKDPRTRLPGPVLN